MHFLKERLNGGKTNCWYSLMFEISQQGLNDRLSSKKYKFHYSEMEIQHLAHMDNSVNVNQTHILLMLTQFLRIKTQ